MGKARPSKRLSSGDVLRVLERVAPRRLAAEWDNVGLIACPGDWRCGRALVAVDLTPDVLDEAIRVKADLVVAYHPPIFKPVKKLKTWRFDAEDLAAEAISRGIAVYSPHTAWDAAAGGTNDVIAAMCGIRETRPFTYPPVEPGRECKIVVFVPAEHVERVAQAMFATGAGRIGHYTHCSFRLPGQGTFYGSDDTNPRVGKRGRLETVDEVRLEAVARTRCVPDIVAAIRRTHPYEEPAFDIYPLAEHPRNREGPGRIGWMPKAAKLGAVATMLKRATGAANVAIVGHPSAKIERAWICVGAAGSLPFEVASTICGVTDVVITGEIRHHDALRYLRMGASAIALGHWASERPGVAALAKRLQKEMPGVGVRLSRADRDPFKAV